jgi:hypothetical protein
VEEDDDYDEVEEDDEKEEADKDEDEEEASDEPLAKRRMGDDPSSNSDDLDCTAYIG